MKTRPDLNKLSKEVFEANKLKGFHDKSISNETLLMLVITELSEAVEADRKGKRANVECFKAFNDFSRPSHDAFSFESTIKDTIEDELADIIIRLLDLSGLREFIIPDINHAGCDFELYTFAENIFSLVKLATYCRDIYLPHNIASMIGYIEELCEYIGIDIWQHVELKLKYNKTRENKHGKLY